MKVSDERKIDKALLQFFIERDITTKPPEESVGLREILTGIAEECVGYSDDGRLHVQKLILLIAGRRMPAKEQAALRAEHEENEQREKNKRREEEKALASKKPTKKSRAPKERKVQIKKAESPPTYMNGHREHGHINGHVCGVDQPDLFVGN